MIRVRPAFSRPHLRSPGFRSCVPAPECVDRSLTAERCRSGRTGRSRKPLWAQVHPGFESLSLRHLLKIPKIKYLKIDNHTGRPHRSCLEGPCLRRRLYEVGTARREIFICSGTDRKSRLAKTISGIPAGSKLQKSVRWPVRDEQHDPLGRQVVITLSIRPHVAPMGTCPSERCMLRRRV